MSLMDVGYFFSSCLGTFRAGIMEEDMLWEMVDAFECFKNREA